MWLALEIPLGEAQNIHSVISLAAPLSITDNVTIADANYSTPELLRRQSARSLRFLRIEQDGSFNKIETRVEKFVGYLKKDYYWTRDCAGCGGSDIPLGPSHALCKEQMKLKGGTFGECVSKDKHDFFISLLEGKSLSFCDLKFAPLRDWQKVAKISNHLEQDAKGGMPIANFKRMLQAENLHDEIGIEEISRFCVIDSEGDVRHYANATDTKGNLIFPSVETATNLKQKLSI